MIDIHTHILPNVDDGSSSLTMSRKMIEEELNQGVNKIVLTPHQNKLSNNKDELVTTFDILKTACKDLDVELFLGAEIYFYEGMINDLIEGKLLTINNSKYVLVEFSTRIEVYIPDIIYELHLAGFIPIVAHIERYSYLKFVDILEIIANGGLIQVNAKSFTSKNYKKTIKKLLKEEVIDFVASDAHDLMERNVDMKEAKKFVLKKYPSQFGKLFKEDFPF